METCQPNGIHCALTIGPEVTKWLYESVSNRSLAFNMHMDKFYQNSKKEILQKNIYDMVKKELYILDY